MKVNVGELVLDENARKYVNDALERNWLSRGKYHELFEKEFARYHNVSHALLVASGTDALKIGYESVKPELKKQVYTSATTFPATWNAAHYGGMPVYGVDINKETWLIDMNDLDARLKSVPANEHALVVPVHLFGVPCDMPHFEELQQKYGFSSVEDSCESMFSTFHGRSVGTWGDFAAFSMYVSHIITAGVGGIITTNNDALFERAKTIAVHGQEKQGVYVHKYPGHSSRITELEAAIAYANVQRIEHNITSRKHNYTWIRSRLEEFDQLTFQKIQKGIDFVPMMLPFKCESPELKSALEAHLQKNGIATRELFPIIEKAPLNLNKNYYPHSYELQKNGLYMGCHEHLTKEQLEYVVQTIETFLKKQ
ncbi:hypothetical protein COT72_03730 [archaeon CG10_big_fil_rev_8_21_14_0_10_43_11]|nr:MAG: hypothetical protein COT72_03730 [archaeon CG10_big_fil_rev_8_21_14_0_10_43_11]